MAMLLHPDSPSPSQLKAATRQAAISTASLGRHDRVVAGENVADRKLPGKRKKLPPVANKVGLMMGGRGWYMYIVFVCIYFFFGGGVRPPCRLHAR